MTVSGLFAVQGFTGRNKYPGLIYFGVMIEFEESEIVFRNLSDEEIQNYVPPMENGGETCWLFYGAYRCGGGFSPTVCTDYKVFDIIKASTFAEAIRKFTENNQCRLMYLDDHIRVRRVDSKVFQFNIEEFYEVRSDELQREG